MRTSGLVGVTSPCALRGAQTREWVWGDSRNVPERPQVKWDRHVRGPSTLPHNSIIGGFCSSSSFYDEHSSVKIAFHQHLWCDRQGTRYRGFHCELDRPTHCPLELVGYAKGTGQTAYVMVAEYSMQLECVLLKSRCRKNSHWKGCSGWKAGGRVGDEGNPVLTEAASRMAIQKGGRYRAPGNLGCSPGLGPHGLCLVSTSSLLWRRLGFIPQQLGSYRLNTAGTWQNT